MEKILNVAHIIVLLMLTFVGGAFLSTANIFPASYIADAYAGGKALYVQLWRFQDVLDTDIWHPAPRPEKGVVEQKPDLMQPGMTIYTSSAEAKAVLVSANGDVLHEWRMPYSGVWDEEARIANPRQDSHVYFRRAKPLPNGDLLVVYEAVGDSPYGYGAVKLDAESNVLWTYLDHAHHDVDQGPDGRIYLLTHDFVNEPVEGFKDIDPPWLEDYLVILSPDGEEQKRIALTPLFLNSPYAKMLGTVAANAVRDPLHGNSVAVLRETNGAAFHYGEAGQVLISFRELNAVALIDPDQEKLVWAKRGSWLAQHDVDALDNGNLLLFDNLGNYDQPEGASRVIEFDPVTEEIVWSYAGTAEQPLHSAVRSAQERLPNGNTLITESSKGRIVEVTAKGEIVWDYLNPDRAGDGEEKIAIVCWAERLAPDFFDDAFTERFLTKVAARSTPDPQSL